MPKATSIAEGKALNWRSYCLAKQVKGKRFPVEVFSASPLGSDPSARGWRDWGVLAGRSRPAAREGGGLQPRRRKRSSVLIDESFEAKAGAKMKPIVGRQAVLEQVFTCLGLLF